MVLQKFKMYVIIGIVGSNTNYIFGPILKMLTDRYNISLNCSNHRSSLSNPLSRLTYLYTQLTNSNNSKLHVWFFYFFILTPTSKLLKNKYYPLYILTAEKMGHSRLEKIILQAFL